MVGKNNKKIFWKVSSHEFVLQIVDFCKLMGDFANVGHFYTQAVAAFSYDYIWEKNEKRGVSEGT